MKNEKLLRAIGGIGDEYIAEAAPDSDAAPARGRGTGGRRWKRSLVILAAAVALLGITAAADSSLGFNLFGFNILDWIAGAYEEPLNDAPVIQAQLDEGQWVYLNGDNIAVVLPESPVKILLSEDAGKTWRESVVAGTETMYLYGDWRDDVQYLGGYIGFSGAEDGYLVLCSPPASGSQYICIYLTSDGGKEWREIGNPNEETTGVVTGAGFASGQTGFISHRYYVDSGPEIWRTSDGGETWSRLEVQLPAPYQAEKYRFTPLSPVFEELDGEVTGVYPMTVVDSDTQTETTICMYSRDGGMSWSFDN